MVNDRVADTITRIRNGLLINRRYIDIPVTKINQEILQILARIGFIDKFLHPPETSIFVVVLGYEVPGTLRFVKKGRVPRISQIKQISKPGCRIYSKSKKIPRVADGYGTIIVSTSRGMMTSQQARAKNLGGELLMSIW